MNGKQRTFVADFETTTKPEDCRVWAYAITEVGNSENVIIGTNIDEFMQWCRMLPDNPVVMFHNLKFDIQFIFYWLFNNNFKCVPKEERATGTFTPLISDKGMYYRVEVVFYLKGKNVKKVTFQDSLKLIPLSVEAIGKAFKLPELQKLQLDYKSHDNLPPDTPLTDDEKAYISNDVRIVAHAIEYFYSQGLNKMTIGSCALDEFKKLITKRNFNNWFPTPKYHDDVKQSYRGGFTYLNPEYANKTIGNGVVLDVNSLYPSVMYDSYLPFGTPIFFRGKYEDDELYPIYTQMIRCSFEIKKGKIPTIQIKNSMRFSSTEYLTSSNDEEVALCLNSVDLALFFEHYDVYNLEYISGWKFKCAMGIFEKYIDKWSANKINAKKEGNHGLYLISKLFLNSLYGKFGTSNVVRGKMVEMGEDGNLHFYDTEPEQKDGIYIAMASFITSYARKKTINSFQKVLDDYNNGLSDIIPVYADTDSLHCISPNFDVPSGLDVDDTRLGAWKFESKFRKAKFLRSKCYIEDSTEDIESDNPEYELKVTVAGMPKQCHHLVTFRNFKIGARYEGKLQPKVVPGGTVLVDVDFTIKK